MAGKAAVTPSMGRLCTAVSPLPPLANASVVRTHDTGAAVNTPPQLLTWPGSREPADAVCLREWGGQLHSRLHS